MKLRKYFTLALHCLLVFGFCLPLIAEEEEDEPDLSSRAEIAKMMQPKTLVEAQKAFEDLDHYYSVSHKCFSDIRMQARSTKPKKFSA